MEAAVVARALATAGEHYRAGRWVEAQRMYRQILAVSPTHYQALCRLAELAVRAGNAPLAIMLLRQATAAEPDRVEAHLRLGDLLSQSNQLDSAIAGYRNALRCAPENPDLLTRLGGAVAMAGKFEEAEALHRRVIQLMPASAAARTNLGNLFRVQSKMDPAIAEYEVAIRSDPAFAPAHGNLGNVLKDTGRLPQAMVAFERAVELDPSSAVMHSNLVYAACFSPDYDSHRLLEKARGWAEKFEIPLQAAHRPHDNQLGTQRRLLVGYVSMDFRDHVIGRNVLPILEHHDRAAFEVHCFSVLARHDAMTALFMSACDVWHECAVLDDATLAEKIRALRIDILVDLSLHTAGNRLLTFARRPAPVQITWAGYPGTTGLAGIEYRITDPYLDPPPEYSNPGPCCSEQSIRLPHSFWCYRPAEGAPELNNLPAAGTGCVTFGCLNNFAKVTRPTTELWAAVMLATAGSRLIVLSPGGSHRGEFLASMDSLGVSASRIAFVGPTSAAEYLHYYHRIDISLDPTPYTGHTTTLDALWMGVPVVTLRGGTSVSRGSVTALVNTGLEELVTLTPAEYVNAAVRLAADLPRVAALRHQLRNRLRRSPICDEAGFTADLERLYRQVWEAAADRCRG
jgi:predicted O-linked N-acetylglucosamine transferase (SPINDLY family)